MHVKRKEYHSEVRVTSRDVDIIFQVTAVEISRPPLSASIYR